MLEVIHGNGVTCFPYARQRADGHTGGIWQGVVDVVTAEGRRVVACPDFHLDPSEAQLDANVEALALAHASGPTEGLEGPLWGTKRRSR